MNNAIKIAATLLAFAPVSAFAQSYSCAFEAECFDAEVCSNTTYELSFTIEGSVVSVSDMNGDFTATALTPDVGFLTGTTSKSYSMLTVAGDIARYTIQDIENEYTILYIGSCEATE